jgi:WD40 repeat protein
VSIVDVTPTQDQMVLVKEGEISIWDTSTNKVVFTMQGKTSWLDSIAISPNGQKLITVGSNWGDGTVQIWDLTSQSVIKVLDQYNLSPSRPFSVPMETLSPFPMELM